MNNILSLVSTFSPIDTSFLPSAIDLFTTLSALRVSPTHPLLAYLDVCVLGGTGITLCKAKEQENNTKKSGKNGAKKSIGSSSSSSLSYVGCLVNIESAWLQRRGLMPEELIAEGCLRVRSLPSADTESSLQALQRATATTTSSSSGAGAGASAAGGGGGGGVGSGVGSGLSTYRPEGGGTLESALGTTNAVAVSLALNNGEQSTPPTTLTLFILS